MDKRWHKLAEVLVNYSARVQRGERVMIAMHEVETLPLVRAVYEAAVRAGAHVQVQFLSDYLRHALLRSGSPEQIAWVPEIEAHGMEWADVYFGLRGAHNPHELSRIPPDRLSLHQQAQGKISTLRWQHTRWCLARVPNAALAQQAGVDEETLLDAFFSACLRDWRAEGGRWAGLAQRLEAGRELRLVGRDTDLCFSVAGRRWLVGAGRMNMPDGEIYTAPVTESVNGYIYFEFPGVFGGRAVSDIRLAWENGRLVQASASENETYMREVLATDEGAGRVGEFALGVNEGWNLFCRDMLLDEKIGGTVHLALGRSYPECGGDNRSAVHWDIVKDTRQEGAIYLDGEKIFESGRFLV